MSRKNGRIKIKVFYGPFLTEEEREKRLDDFLARTSDEDLFPEAYKRFISNLERAGLIPPLETTPDQHQTPPSLS